MLRVRYRTQSAETTHASQTGMQGAKCADGLLLLGGFLLIVFAARFGSFLFLLLADDHLDNAQLWQTKWALRVAPAIIRLHLLNSFVSLQHVTSPRQTALPLQTLINGHSVKPSRGTGTQPGITGCGVQIKSDAETTPSSCQWQESLSRAEKFSGNATALQPRTWETRRSVRKIVICGLYASRRLCTVFSFCHL